jgi:two-component system phosphate regulon sensor histidine kinase PhoR
MRFRQRIFWPFAVVLAGAMVVAYLLFSSVVSKEFHGQAATNAMRYLKHIDWLVHRELQTAEPSRLQDVLKEIGQNLNLRVTYIDASGRVVADSGLLQEEIAGMENHAGRPEIQEAMRTGTGQSLRYSSTLQTSFLYVSLRTEPISGSRPAVLRVAMPTRQVQTALDRVRGQLVFFLAGVVLLTGVLSWLISRRLGIEITTLSASAEAIGAGDLNKRIEQAPGRDFQPLVQSINRMAKRLQATLHEVSNRRDELETLLNGMHEGVFVLDARGKVAMANTAMLELSGASGSVLHREPIEFLRSPELQELCTRMLGQSEGRTEHVFLHLPRDICVEATVIPVRFKALEEQRLIVVLHDVTELKKLEQVRKDFVANVSHELRTPLTAIKGYAESLAAHPGQDPGQVRDFVQVIVRNANQMNHMLDNLLQLARLEAKGAGRDQAAADAQTVLVRAWEACRPLAREREVRLHNELPEHRVWVAVDPDQLYQVWVNLLDNALKYGPAQSWIRAWAEEGEQEWTLALQDNGPGLEAGQRERIFERFYRGRRGAEQDHPQGSGLGLAICRHILANSKGRIWVQSPAPDTLEGSVFSFSLPKAGPGAGQ